MTKMDLNALVVQILGSEELVSIWWHTPNQHWNGETPYQVWCWDPTLVETYLKLYIKK